MNEQELANTSFKDVVWLQRIPLTVESVLDYFSLSPFYDRSCNNEVLKMQTKFVNVTVGLAEQLRQMVGIEYSIARANPPSLFVIEKVERKSPQETLLLASFYVLDGTIYQCPDLHSLIATRLSNCAYFLEAAIQKLKGAVEFDAIDGVSVVRGGPQSPLDIQTNAKEQNLLNMKEKGDELVAINSVVGLFNQRSK